MAAVTPGRPETMKALLQSMDRRLVRLEHRPRVLATGAGGSGAPGGQGPPGPPGPQGAQGVQGPVGPKGDALKIDSFTPLTAFTQAAFATDLPVVTGSVPEIHTLVYRVTTGSGPNARTTTYNLLMFHDPGDKAVHQMPHVIEGDNLGGTDFPLPAGWQYGGVLKGVQGDPGPQGVQGPMGPAGAGFHMPAGMVMAYAGKTVPTGWLECDGHQFNTTTYPALAAVLGTDHVPDYRDRFLLGAATHPAVGQIGGSSTAFTGDAGKHDHTYTLGTNAAPLHTGADGAHSHTFTLGTNQNPMVTGDSGVHHHQIGAHTTSSDGHTHSISGTPGTHGSGVLGGIVAPLHATSDSHSHSVPAHQASDSAAHHHTLPIAVHHTGGETDHTHTLPIAAQHTWETADHHHTVAMAPPFARVMYVISTGA